MERIIDEIQGEKAGPLIILLGSLHGNETAGVKAIYSVFERIRRDNINIHGRIVGLLGNKTAYHERRRFIDYDLNRAWTEENIKRLKENGRTFHFREDYEMSELLSFFDSIPENGHHEKICVDLHTTSSDNGNFIVVPESSAGHPVIKALKLPRIIDLEKHIKGTLLTYLINRNILSFAFEGGLIGSKIAVRLHEAGIWEIMITAGMIDKEYVSEELHLNVLLQTFASELPGMLRVKYHYWITENDGFKMKPGYINFQKVKEGEEIAEDRNGPVRVPMDGMIFMPLYQRSGNDGFFIVQEEESFI